MSTAQAAPDPEVAYNALYAQVHAPVFFAKLAQHGIVPSTPTEEQDLLKLGHQLSQLEQREVTKQASAQGAFISATVGELDRVLGWQPETQDRAVKAAADYYAAQPALLQAAMVLNAAR